MDNSKRRIASLALFRNLYNDGRSDVMTILCEFAKNIVYSKHLTAFTPTQIKNELKSEYDFYIPEYVVQTVLKRFCRKENSKYYPNSECQSHTIYNQEIEKIEKSHDLIISNLVSYVEEKVSRELTSKEIENLTQSFCGYLLDESDVEYAEYISAFIIKTKNDDELSSLLRTIKEGVVLYTGIQYNDNISETGSWKNDFTIFVEQEILFHMAGYNGVLYQQLFQDFFELIKEINRKAHKQIIKVKYFDSVKNEIEKFFNIAERIVDGKDTLDCSNIAMSTIVHGCEYKTDVIEKKCVFYDILNKNLISEEKFDHYNEKSEFNIFYEENIKTLSNDLPERDVEWSLHLLSCTNMIRSGNTSAFDKSKCILLTGNSTTMAIALHPLIKQNGDVPLATTLDFITNKLWFKLNKGFGNNVYPKSFNIVTKAQIVLSTQIVGSVAKEFEKIKKEITEKGKSEEIIIAELTELKTKVRKPEEIQETATEEVLATISMADTERYLRERELERQEAARQKEENERLKNEVNRSCQEKKELSSQLDKSIKNEKNRIKEQIDAINRRKEKADIKVQKMVSRLRWIPFTIIVLVVVIVGFGTYWYGWDKMEFLTWLVSVLISSVPFLVFGLGFKEWNPKNVITVWYKNKYEKKLYEEYDVDLIKLQQLMNDL